MSSTLPLMGLNLSLLAGTLSSPPELRTLPSGATLLALQVSVRPPDGPAESVPVAWFDPPAAATDWLPGDEIVVVGRVRRRFFRTGGATASRTEVVATSVVPARRRAASTKALCAALDEVRASLTA